MKKSTRTIIVVVVVALALLFLFGGQLNNLAIFSGNIDIEGVVLQEGFYQFAGNPPLTKQDYIPGQSNTCLPQQIIYTNKVYSDESTINTANYQYKFVTKNVRPALDSRGQPCSTIYYDTDVYRNGQIIDTIRFNNPDQCFNAQKSSNLVKSYDEVNATFGKRFIRGGDTTYCGAQAFSIVHQYSVLYPAKTLSFNLNSASLVNDVLTTTIDYKNNYHQFSGKVGVIYIIPSAFGEQTFKQEQDVSSLAVGSNVRTFTSPLTTSEATIKIVPYAILYSSTSRLSGINGDTYILDIPDCPTCTIPRTNVNQFSRYILGTFTGSQFSVIIRNDTVNSTSVSGNGTTVNPSNNTFVYGNPNPIDQPGNTVTPPIQDQDNIIDYQTYILSAVALILLILIIVYFARRKK